MHGSFVSGNQVIALLRKNSKHTAYIVQSRLINYPDIADLACGTLATVRVMSCRNESGGYEVTNAMFRMKRNNDTISCRRHRGQCQYRNRRAGGRYAQRLGCGDRRLVRAASPIQCYDYASQASLLGKDDRFCAKRPCPPLSRSGGHRLGCGIAFGRFLLDRSQ